MKKMILLAALCTTLAAMEATAQNGGTENNGDQAAMAQRMKERTKTGLMEKAKLTDDQAEKVIAVNMELRNQMRGLRDLSEEERKTRIAALDVQRDQKYKGIPLTDDQVKAVNAYFDEMRKNRAQGQRPAGQ